MKRRIDEMERMKILDVNFADMTATPFFQVEAKNRIRFDIELFEGNLRGLRGILTELFKSLIQLMFHLFPVYNIW